MDHEGGQRRLLAPSFRSWLHRFASDLEDGVYSSE
jgi:hypothetical protein